MTHPKRPRDPNQLAKSIIAVSLRKKRPGLTKNERLRQLATSGVSIFRAAAALKRKTGSTRTQARKIGCRSRPSKICA